MHAGYDFMFWNFNKRIQGGLYLTAKGHEMKGNFFFRPALQYSFGDNLFAQVGFRQERGLRPTGLSGAFV